MNTLIEDSIFNSIDPNSRKTKSNVIKAEDVQISGCQKISFEEEDSDGVKVLVTKDKDDNIREIKFICSCGQTKSLKLDYAE